MKDKTAVVIHKVGTEYCVNVEFRDELMFFHSYKNWDEVIREVKRLGSFLFDAPLPPQAAPDAIE
jgi:hypothetical protein